MSEMGLGRSLILESAIYVGQSISRSCTGGGGEIFRQYAILTKRQRSETWTRAVAREFSLRPKMKARVHSATTAARRQASGSGCSLATGLALRCNLRWASLMLSVCAGCARSQNESRVRCRRTGRWLNSYILRSLWEPVSYGSHKDYHAEGEAVDCEWPTASVQNRTLSAWNSRLRGFGQSADDI
jgi:hypothetical protein